MRRLVIAAFAISLLGICCFAYGNGLAGKSVRFGQNGKYSGYLVRPEGTGPLPGLVVIHELWGLTPDNKQQADRLAKEGYVVLAVDMFNGKTTQDAGVAAQLVQNLSDQAATEQLLAASGYLRSLSYVEDRKVGVIGWCFGGTQALRLALNDPNLAVTVIYYGTSVETDPNKLENIKSPILGIYGAEDQNIPQSKVLDFDRALTAANVPHWFYIYPDAGHAFANPTNKAGYRPQAAADAWKRTLAFLEMNLKCE